MNHVFSIISLLLILLTTSFIQVSSAKSCKLNVDCKRDEICAYFECKLFDLFIFEPCVNISQCKVGEKCVFGKCRIPSLGGPCNNDLDCPAIGTCKNGRCAQWYIP